MNFGRCPRVVPPPQPPPLDHYASPIHVMGHEGKLHLVAIKIDKDQLSQKTNE